MYVQTKVRICIYINGKKVFEEDSNINAFCVVSLKTKNVAHVLFMNMMSFPMEV